MKKFFLFLLFFPLFAKASPAELLQAHESIVINANPSQVWKVLGNYNGMKKWVSTVENSIITKGINNQVGAVRHLTFSGQMWIDEELTDYNDKKMLIRYTALDGSFPFSDYKSEIKLQKKESSTLVEWSGTFKRRCLVPQCRGVLYTDIKKEELWDKHSMEAPARQRQYVEKYNIVKRA